MIDQKYKDFLNLDEGKRRKRRKKFADSISYFTGDIGLNIDHFNKLMGTFGLDSNASTEASGLGDAGNDGIGSAESSCGMGESLIEAKRYVRRYYIRPLNIFCSNKAEIIKALIDHQDSNFTVYTLNNLGDDKDISKLMNSDIIYFYDEGILYDKNHVRIMDYQLKIANEEDRKRFSKIDDTSNEFKTEYEDRMTAATELEEEFDYFNAFTDDLFESKASDCCICGEAISGKGHNPEPYLSALEGKACDSCYAHFVLPLVGTEEA